MSDLKRVTVVAMALIVVLRLSIGWQFLYEGLWKYDTLNSPNPWSAEGYLKSAQGPFRDKFRAMTGDPDDLGWLDLEKMNQRWTAWRSRFATHYQLDEAQRKELAALIDPPGAATQALNELPASVDPKKFPQIAGKPVVSFDPIHKQLVAPNRLLPAEVESLKKMVSVIDVGGSFKKIGPDGQPLRDGAVPVPASESDVALYQGIVELAGKLADPKQTQRLSQLKQVAGIVPQGDKFVRVDEDGTPLTTGGDLVDADPIEANFSSARTAL